jgi:hypothetical protein
VSRRAAETASAAALRRRDSSVETNRCSAK